MAHQFTVSLTHLPITVLTRRSFVNDYSLIVSQSYEVFNGDIEETILQQVVEESVNLVLDVLVNTMRTCSAFIINVIPFLSLILD